MCQTLIYLFIVEYIHPSLCFSIFVTLSLILNNVFWYCCFVRLFVFFFFFQAEDGIRDHCVTGVQTCALPIWAIWSRRDRDHPAGGCAYGGEWYSLRRSVSQRHGLLEGVRGPLRQCPGDVS